MDYATIHYEQRDSVAVITYDRQERRNAWNVPMYREIEHAIERANNAAEVGAIVLTHAGPIFCSGTDFKSAPEPRDPVTGVRPNIAMVSMAEETGWIHLLARSKPTIAAVSGAAIGLGVTQLLPVDIRLAGESATFSFPFLSLGVMPELGCTALLPRLVGYGRAVDICLTSAKLTAAEALMIGLVTRVVADAEVLDAAVELGARLAALPVLQLTLTRDLLRRNVGEFDANVFLKRETEAFIEMFKARKAAASQGA